MLNIAKIGLETINLLNTDYKKDIINEWSEREYLRCSRCNEVCEYCNEGEKGYFKHKEDEICKYWTIDEKRYYFMVKLNSLGGYSEYIGKIGDKIKLEVKLINNIPYGYNNYSGTLFKFTDKDNNVLVWSTNTKIDVELGDCIIITGKIKKHELFESVKQTRLIRCSVFKEEIND